MPVIALEYKHQAVLEKVDHCEMVDKLRWYHDFIVLYHNDRGRFLLYFLMTINRIQQEYVCLSRS